MTPVLSNPDASPRKVPTAEMTPDRLLDMVGRPGGPLADANLWKLEVAGTGLLSSNIQRVELRITGPGELQYKAGQDLMLRVPLLDDGVVNRRYTIRRFDPLERVVALDASLHGAGPGTNWIRSAAVGSRIDAIGPRGKVTLREDAAWHLFVDDETGLPGALAMIESMPGGSTAIGLFEVDSSADEQLPATEHFEGLDIRWIHRLGNSSAGDAAALLEAVTGTELPAGRGHVYVAAETRVARAIQESLMERGLGADQISAKAYWRKGLPNAEHGEPTRED
jgi:NADPH-dependent ferric siderophore reductase